MTEQEQNAAVDAYYENESTKIDYLANEAELSQSQAAQLYTGVELDEEQCHEADLYGQNRFDGPFLTI